MCSARMEVALSLDEEILDLVCIKLQDADVEKGLLSVMLNFEHSLLLRAFLSSFLS